MLSYHLISMMMNKLHAVITYAVLLLFVQIATAQQVVEYRSADGSLTVKSYISSSDVIDSIIVDGVQWRLTWREEQIMEKEDCHLINELVGTCAILDPPMISGIERLDSNAFLLFGGNRSGPLRDRQLILLDANTGAILGWYGYITWRGNDVCKMFIDLQRRTLLIGAKENDMFEDCFYVVDRSTMTMEPLQAETSPVKALEISLLGDYRPTVVRKGYFQISF
jgi:hypothetical protein